MFDRKDLADVGVIGGSGFYELLSDVEHHAVQTPFGPPSSTLAIGTYEGTRVAFLARHGPGHRYPPHRINYRANIWALASVGVTRILGPNASGSLQPHVKPGDFVVVPFARLPRDPSPFPAGFAPQPTPFTMAFTGLPCSEPRLLALAYAFEQATRRRVPPPAFP